MRFNVSGSVGITNFPLESRQPLSCQSKFCRDDGARNTTCKIFSRKGSRSINTNYSVLKTLLSIVVILVCPAFSFGQNASAILGATKKCRLDELAYSVQYDQYWEETSGSSVRSSSMSFMLSRSTGGEIYEGLYLPTAGIKGDWRERPAHEFIFKKDSLVQYQSDQNDGFDLYLIKKPSLTDSHGLRAGNAILTGISRHHSKERHDLFDIIRDAGCRFADSHPPNIFRVQSQTEVGTISIDVSDTTGLIEKICIEASSDDFWLGEKLGALGFQSIDVVFDDFKYTTTNGVFVASAYTVSELRSKTNGETKKIDSRLQLKEIQIFPDSVGGPNIDFVNTIKNGTKVEASDNKKIGYEWRNGWFQKVIDKQHSALLKGFRFSSSSAVDELGPLSRRDGMLPLEWEAASDHPLCGVYCVYAVADALDSPVAMDTILTEEFISKDYGSSTADLVNAISEVGLSSRVASGMGPIELHTLDSPAILHVRGRMGGGPYNHWVLFLGRTKGGQLSILDPTYGYQELDSAIILSRFDGTAIIVDENEAAVDSTMRGLFVSRWCYSLVAGVLLIALFLGVTWAHRNLMLRSVGLMGFLLATVVLGALFHVFSPSGFLSNRLAVLKRISADASMPSFNEIDFERLKELLENDDKGVVLIDARYRASFERGSIPRAINYPPNISESKELEFQSKFKPETHLIVFCQSSMCEYDLYVANRLHHYGFKKISIYKKGYREWKVLSKQ